MSTITNTKAHIEQYKLVFAQASLSFKEDGNELVVKKQQFEQGMKLLDGQLEILTLVEGLVSNLDLSKLEGTISQMHQDGSDVEKRFYNLDNRVKMVSDIVLRRLTAVEKQRAQKTIIVKRNPLLDHIDDKHNRANQRLIDRSPDNM